MRALCVSCSFTAFVALSVLAAPVSAGAAASAERDTEGKATAHELSGSALIQALRKGGYVLVM